LLTTGYCFGNYKSKAVSYMKSVTTMQQWRKLFTQNKWGKRSIFKNDENGGTPVSIVGFVVPIIMKGEMVKLADQNQRIK
jgi:hypothetical protein